jgi:O-methyltransferase involved in polyketide biosynthesis
MDVTDAEGRIRPELEGVPETLLWTLYHRALEARRPDAVLHDPIAVELVDRIDYPFAERFGETGSLAQWQALRVRGFDREVRRFLAAHPGGSVVALGEGLETQFRRVDDGSVQWIGVDLPETAEVRRRLLPDPPRHRTIARSALDLVWTDEVDPTRGVLITAQGLLMYFEPDDVHRLIAACARRFPGAALLFDAVPRPFADLTRKAKPDALGRYRPPPWTWALDRAERRRLEALDGVDDLKVVPLPRGRGVAHGFLLPLATRLPGARLALLAVLLAGFRSA